MKRNIFKKEYIAIIEGILKNKIGTISVPIKRKNDSIIEREVSFDKDSDIAITHYEILKELSVKLSVIKVILETGRTHQIRVHFSYIGHSIIADTLYGKESPYMERQALHAYKVSFYHPITKKKMNIVCKLPNDMESIITKFNIL